MRHDDKHPLDRTDIDPDRVVLNRILDDGVVSSAVLVRYAMRLILEGKVLKSDILQNKSA